MFGLQKKQLTDATFVNQLIDLLITPNWRKTGLFNILAEKAFDYFKHIGAYCVIPNLNGKLSCERSLGIKTLIKIDKLVYDINKKNNKNESLKTKKLKTTFEFKKNKKFYVWRFDNNPEYSYQKIIINPIFFAYIKIFVDPETKIKYGDIVDIKLDKKNLHRSSELIEKIIGYFKNKKITSITTWALPRTEIYEILTKNGFNPISQERYFCLKIIDNKLKKLNNINNWNILPSDMDLF
jgi:hypothetical protein